MKPFKITNAKIILTAAVSLFLLITGQTGAFAQTTNFSGTWLFKNQHSMSGNLYANGSPKQVRISQNDPAITISSVTANGSADTTVTEMLTANKPFESETGATHRKIVSTVQWVPDGTGFTEIMTIYSKSDPGKADYRNTDKWALKNGELTLDRKSENSANGETWESTAIYTKQ